MRDISNWSITGFGENSTLEKLDLVSPSFEPYVMKFPRPFDGTRTNWEDVNEIIASKIAGLLDMFAVDAEIVTYKNRRACLMKNFRYQIKPDYGETIASLLTSVFQERYDELHTSKLSNEKRMEAFLSVFHDFEYYSALKSHFVEMNLFDILIGNQDRHGHNWQLLFKGNEVFPSPLYDNGASLGWQLPDEQLKEMLESEKKMDDYFKGTVIKIGLDNIQSPKIKAKTF